PAGRKSVRYFVGFMPKQVPPPAFVKLPPLPVDQIVSTMLLLADAAKECGKTDELAAEADKLATDKVENADLLKVLVDLASRRVEPGGSPAVKAFADAARKRLTDKPEPLLGSPNYDL